MIFKQEAVFENIIGNGKLYLVNVWDNSCNVIKSFGTLIHVWIIFNFAKVIAFKMIYFTLGASWFEHFTPNKPNEERAHEQIVVFEAFAMSPRCRSHSLYLFPVFSQIHTTKSIVVLRRKKESSSIIKGCLIIWGAW